MSIYSLSTSNVSRAKLQSSVAAYAYISGEEVTDERTGEVKKYKRQDKILDKGNILPDDAPQRYKDNAATWINDIEKYEQADNARPCKKYVMALPRELDLEQQKLIVEKWIRQNCTKHGYAATYAIHQSKDGQNPHVHILVANRALKNGKWQRSKSKTVYKLDEQGNKIPMLDENGKQKVRIRPGKGAEKMWMREKIEESYLDSKNTLQTMRESWATTCNQYLAPDQQIDHRSYAARGIMRAPTIHEGYEARAVEKRGGVSWRCEHNRQVKDINRQYQQALFEENALEDKLEGVQSKLSGAKAAAGKVGGLAGQAEGAVKGAISQGVGAIIGESDGKGMQGVMERTMEEVGKSLVQGNIAGAGMAVAKMPLDVLKNVESDDVKRDKLREQMEKAQAEEGILGMGGSKKKKKKDKGKGKGKEQGEHAPLVRSRGR